jgi:hypothetical protein
MTSANHRIALGLIAAFFAVLLVAFLIGCASVVFVVGWPRLLSDLSDTATIGFMVMMGAFPFTAVSAFAIGLPALGLLQHEKYTSFLSYFAAGLAIALVLSGALFLSHHFMTFLTDSDFDLSLWIAGIGAPVGALACRRVIGAYNGESTEHI